MNLEIELRGAMERNEFQLYFQPQADVATSQIVCLEALVRWAHPALGMISPTEFIPIAEETGSIESLGAWVMRTACAAAARWNQAELRDVRVAVNVSPRQFANAAFSDFVSEVLRDTKLPSHLLELEITEGVLMSRNSAVRDSLETIHATGVRVALDDFGTGYSSLSYLKRFPIDKLKIDRSFVKDLPNAEEDVTIVSGIIALAHNLGIEVVAEGVENAAQWQFLADRKCDHIQGNLLAVPAPLAQVLEDVRSAPWSKRAQAFH